MTGVIFQGLLIPFLGTVLGAAMVFLLKGRMSRTLQRILTGSAAGVRNCKEIISENYALGSIL
jgi:ZIP family zinc transporter